MTTRREFLASAATSAALLVFTRSLSAQNAGSRPAGLKVLVLGGTGFIGPHIVEALQKQGHTITLFNRGKTNPHLFPDLEKLVGDRAKKELDALKGRQWDVVIDDAVYIPRHVRELAEAMPQLGYYILISTLSVFADDSRPGADESSATAKLPDPASEDSRKYYGALKALCEQEAEKVYPGKTCVIRPGLIVGPGDATKRFSYWPIRAARGGEMLAPGDGKDPIQVIDVRDLAQFVATCANKKPLGLYNTVGPRERLPMSEFLTICNEACGSKAKLTWVGTDFLQEQKIAPWSDLPAWTPMSKEGKHNSTVNCKKAIAAGLSFRPMAETCKDTLAWYNSQPADQQAKLVGGLSAEREAAALAAWSKK